MTLFFSEGGRKRFWQSYVPFKTVSVLLNMWFWLGVWSIVILFLIQKLEPLLEATQKNLYWHWMNKRQENKNLDTEDRVCTANICIGIGRHVYFLYAGIFSFVACYGVWNYRYKHWAYIRIHIYIYIYVVMIGIWYTCTALRYKPAFIATR